MLKKKILLLLIIFPLIQFAQEISTNWNTHFSYNNIVDVVKGKDKIYAASDNAVFILDTNTNKIEELNTLNGLSGQLISTIHYSELYQLLVIGYETGLIQIVFDNSDEVLSIVDIVERQTILSSVKRINHFSAFNEFIYISTDFGIVAYNLERLVFGDTFFIGGGGSQLPVKQTAIHNGFIYAVSVNGGGIKKADLANSNLIDYKNWQTISSGDYILVESVQGNLYTVRSDRRLYQISNDVLVELIMLGGNPLQMKAESDYLIIATSLYVYVYDKDFNPVTLTASVVSNYNTRFSSATIVEGNLYIGSMDYGILKNSISVPNQYEEIHPNGPLLNVPFSVQTINNGLWVTYGEHNIEFNPYPLNARGISLLKGDQWFNKEYKDLLSAQCLNGITVNPFNTNQVFISSFFSGLLEVQETGIGQEDNIVPVVLYNESNSGLESLILSSDANYKDIRVGGSAFDENGLLWTITSLVDRPLKSFNPRVTNNPWRSYDFRSLIPNGSQDNLGFHEVIIDPVSNIKFIASFDKGVIGFKETSGGQRLKSLAMNENLPVKHVRSLAIDQNNQLWIGTYKGLRVLYNAPDFFSINNLRAESIIILEDGVAKELLDSQFISDIKVDGADNKWIGTYGSGVFYLSPDGQQTIFHFTTENSPLPSNDVNDISINSSTGEVFIATTRGLVSFTSEVSQAAEELNSAYVFPNPVRPNFDLEFKGIKIRGLTENVNLKITDIEGNLVTEGQSKITRQDSSYNLKIEGGTATWNGRNLANNVVASGVYLVMISDLDTSETKTLKLMIIR